MTVGVGVGDGTGVAAAVGVGVGVGVNVGLGVSVGDAVDTAVGEGVGIGTGVGVGVGAKVVAGSPPQAARRSTQNSSSPVSRRCLVIGIKNRGMKNRRADLPEAISGAPLPVAGTFQLCIVDAEVVGHLVNHRGAHLFYYG